MAPFYRWGSTASRLERGGSLLFATSYQKFLVLQNYICNKIKRTNTVKGRQAKKKYQITLKVEIYCSIFVMIKPKQNLIMKRKKLFIVIKKVLASVTVVMNWYLMKSYFIFMELNLNYSVVGSQGLNFPWKVKLMYALSPRLLLGYSRKTQTGGWGYIFWIYPWNF